MFLALLVTCFCSAPPPCADPVTLEVVKEACPTVIKNNDPPNQSCGKWTAVAELENADDSTDDGVSEIDHTATAFEWTTPSGVKKMFKHLDDIPITLGDNDIVVHAKNKAGQACESRQRARQLAEGVGWVLS